MASSPTGTLRRLALGLLLAAIALAPMLPARPAHAVACLGDCGGNAAVTVEEVVYSTRIYLGLERAGQCPGTAAGGGIDAEDLRVAVLNALDGCPDFGGDFGATVDLEPGQSAALTLHAAEDGTVTGVVEISNGGSFARRLGGAAAGTSVSGSFDPLTGEFSVGGTFVDGHGNPIEIALSGRFPRNGDPGSITLRIGSATYSSTFLMPHTPTPTPTRTPRGTVHTVKVGQANLPFDPEVLEIDPGDTVTWEWVGGTHSVVSSTDGPIGSPHCGASGTFDSGVRSSGTYSRTFDFAGTFEYHCGVAGHCEAFESGVIIVRGMPTPTRTYTRTPTPTFALPTVTPTPETIGGVSVRLLGFFSGRVLNDFGGEAPDRIQILVDDFGPLIIDITGNVLGVLGTVRPVVDSPTKLTWVNPSPFDQRSLTVELQPDGSLKGLFTINSMGMEYHLRLEMTREP